MDLLTPREAEDLIVYVRQATGRHPNDVSGALLLELLLKMRRGEPVVPEEKRCLCGSGLPWRTRVERDGETRTKCLACAEDR